MTNATKTHGTSGKSLKFFRWNLALTPALSKRMTILGIDIPRIGAVIVFALSLIAITIWGIIFTRSPQLITQQIEHRYDISDPAFLRSMGVLLGPPLAPGNRIDTLVNGDQIFPAMLEAIRSAKKTVTLETYIYWSGEVGKQVSDALAERARNGVKVHVLVDWVGSHKMDQDMRNAMGRSGVVIMRYHQPRWYKFRSLNQRTHRKLLVVDGKVGFTGGVGIADIWSGNAQDKDHWRDTHYRVEGPVVSQLQAAFSDNWTQATGEVLHGDDYFPPIEARGPYPAQIFKSSRDGGAESMQLMYMLSIAAAKSTIDISMAYFIPDDIALNHLVDALKRGVRLRIIVPGKETDSLLVRAASRARWGRLLQHGAEIYEYEPTMFHCKMVVADGTWSSVGSTNFDTRSFRLNDEANLNVYNREFAQRQEAEFERDLKRAKRVTYEEWKDRPWYVKAWDHAIAFLEPTLAG
jgi:cardiolipin synthase